MPSLALAGVLGPVTTPFTASETPDLVGFASNIRSHLAHGLHGIVVCGSTGEAALLDEAERTTLIETARSAVRRLWASQDDHHPTSAGPDAKSALQEWAQGKGLALPEYVEVHRKGPDHAPRFTSEVRISGCDPARGEGASKRAAEQAAARALLEREGVAGAELHE